MNNSKQNNPQKIMIVCYGNILRSQVLDQYMSMYIRKHNLDLHILSAGVAPPEEFTEKEKLFKEIADELDKRGIPHNLHRNPWNQHIQEQAADTSLILCADFQIKTTVIERLKGFTISNIKTFYEAAGEGEKSFEDTYDYKNRRQDPIKFAAAFSELERLAVKILNNLT